MMARENKQLLWGALLIALGGFFLLHYAAFNLSHQTPAFTDGLLRQSTTSSRSGTSCER